MSKKVTPILACLGCLALGAAISMLIGQDVGWDLRNYHLSNPHAVLHGRLGIDLEPAGLQSYLNPTLDLVYDGLGTGLLAERPRLLAALIGLPYGALIFLTILIAGEVSPVWSRLPRGVAIAAIAIAAATGAGTLTQVGTAFNEVPIAAFVLAGVALILPALHGDGRGMPGRAAAAGAVVGFGAGLKMTALVFAPAFALALLAIGPAPLVSLRRIGTVVGFCASWVAGFAVSAGWWMWLVYQKFGNPFFPLFNGLFRSPWYPPVSFSQTDFLPRTALQWLLYPFWWATWRDRALNSELAYRDPRLAAGLVAALVLAGLAGSALVRGRELPSRALGFVLSFWAVSYLLWLTTSAIMRYGVALEVLGVVLAGSLVTSILRRRPWSGVAATAVAAAACVAWTVVPDYGRVAYGPRVFDVDMDWTPPGTLFVAITGPTAYLTTFVPESAGARTVGFSFINRISADWPLTRRTAAMVRENAGPIYVLIPVEDRSMLPDLPLIGLRSEIGPCRAIHSNLDGSSTRACLAQRLP